MDTTKKLIFFDIDGTIVTDSSQGHYIPDSTRTAIRTLQKNGHMCFINTGRALSELDTAILDLHMDGLVCGCGTYISYHDTVLFEKTIPFPLGNRILQKLTDCRLEWLLEGSHTLYYSNRPYRSRIGSFQGEHAALCVAFETVDPEKDRNLVFDKFCICTDKTSNLSLFQDTFQKDLSFIDRGQGFYEIVPAGCSKASGMKYLMNHFHIPQKNTIAIGDSTNDLPMLEFADTSIAMGGSAPVVCKAADFVTDGIQQDGLLHAFRRLTLL